ncbi:hypothetical protein [uncultured Roseibium sp.]|uniref:hypothetical protein n=1 Tax=uncultured Roseibium sp. TaxID=1936171 RepID=UPI00259912C9|nr:hypothetical protein [uncultured Roseibium sp.]
MAEKPKPKAAEAGTVPDMPCVLATEAAPAVEETVVASKKLIQLFEHLKIVKVICVDDKAELQTDAGAVFKVLAAKPEASEVLAPFFAGVTLNLSNDALQEQLAARLAELGGDKLAELRAVLSAQSEDAAEREVLGRLQDLLPDGIKMHLLTPLAWNGRRTDLIAECSEDQRTLFLFDQELEVDDAGVDFKKGSDIIRDMAKEEASGFGTRWFCGMLTHTVTTGEEVDSWHELAKSEGLDLRFFMPIAKTTLDDAPTFYGAIYRTLINTYCQTMKTLAAGAFEKALECALQQFRSLDPIDFEHMIVKSSEIEGVSELETLIRVYGIIQKDKVKTRILQHPEFETFSAATRTVKQIADIGRNLSASSQERLHTLRREELYESHELVNNYHEPLRNGDVFEIDEGISRKLWVLIAQPCDLMVRSNGKRVREDNFKVAVLAPLRTRELGEDFTLKESLHFSLDHFDHNGAQSAVVMMADATPANLHVLDLAVLNKDGVCFLSATADPNLSLHSKAWERRCREIRKHFGRVTKQIESAREKHEDAIAALLADAIIPRASPQRACAKYGAYNEGAYSYPIRRLARVRDPLAVALLGAYSRFLARDAYDHDFSRSD